MCMIINHSYIYILILDLYTLSQSMCYTLFKNNNVGEWGWGVQGKQVGSMDEESQVRG